MRRSFVLVFALAASCRPFDPPPELNPVRQSTRLGACATRCTDSLLVTFLGIGGVVLRRGREAVITAPHFSTPGFLALGNPIRPNHALIDARVATLITGPKLLDGATVNAILVGHGH